MSRWLAAELDRFSKSGLCSSAQIPLNEPMLLVPAMSLVTEHHAFGVTAPISFERPYTFARRIPTLDHLTEGRAGWDIVTSYLESGARNIGLGGQSAHDDRYDVADGYMEVSTSSAKVHGPTAP